MSDPGFVAIRSAGGLLPVDTLAAVIEGNGLDGLTPSDYHLLPGETLRGEANRAWQRLLGAWRVLRDSVDSLPEGDPAIGVTRERFLLPLFASLGYGRLDTTPAGGLEIDGQAFPVSHIWRSTPIHLLGYGVDLDRRTSGVAGAARAAPHAMVQELLNRSDDHLWGFVSNGRTLRVLRDNASLVRQAYLDFDLAAIFDGELFSEFVALFMVCHQSRVEARDDTGPRSCWLEVWRTASVAAGTRALDHLRDGVIIALRSFGSGFLRHPANEQLRAGLASGHLTPQDYYRSLLRLAYRLLFVFVAEDRNLLHHPDAKTGARDRYARYFSTARLRRLAVRSRSGDRHPDLWQSLQLVFDALGKPEGLPALGLPNLGGFLFDPETLGPLSSAELANADLLAALRPLALVRDAGGLTRTIDYRNLDSEELGSVYESLLQLVPRHDPGAGEFALAEIAGNERKTTGSYYTPSSLIASLLDTALDPLLDDVVKTAGGAEEAEAALLAMTVCDPACGSGHFLVAAARRIAKRLAAVRTGDPEPAPDAVRTALRDVVGRCVYGVDVNDLAAELAKVSLWLEALEPGKPLSFLDAKIKVGNALLGATPALLADGIPDKAFAPLAGDDKKHTANLKKRNSSERKLPAQTEFFDVADLHRGTAAIAERLAEVERYDDDSPAGLAARTEAWRRLEISPELQEARFLADAWCAAFVWPKTADAPSAITDAGFRMLNADPRGASPELRGEVARLAQDYRFFHWHLEFPDVFTVPDDLAVTDNPGQGWSGGFTAVIGNPPWEHTELKEQEYFASRDAEIAIAAGAARKRLIAALPTTDPDLWHSFSAAKRLADGLSHHARSSGRFPLCGRGRINTYALFAETDRTLVAPRGRTGVILPTGIATDATTQYFFRDVVESAALVSLYDFENRQPLFQGVDSRFKFCLLTLTGRADREAVADFAFFCHEAADLDKPDVRFQLTPAEILLLNPNTGTCPVFRSRRDAEITLGIYRRVPILLREGNPSGNPWGLSFMQGLFNMTSDSHLFRTREQLEADGWALAGNTFTRGRDRMLPLYESKMIHQYDHRWATYDGSEARDVTTAERTRAEFRAVPRYWVADAAAGDRWPGAADWQLVWRGIARSTDWRTAIAALLPRYPGGGNFDVAVPQNPMLNLTLVAVMNSLAFDFVTRQKLSGMHVQFSVVKQLPMPAPSFASSPCPWDSTGTASEWINPRVVELSYVASDLSTFARALGDYGEPFLWQEMRRATLRAELDAASFRLFGVDREGVEHVLDTFPIICRKDMTKFGEFRTKKLVLEIYDAMAEATATGSPYQTVLDPPPGQGPRHEER